MPLYEYRCGTCGERFEALRRITDGVAGLACPRCGGTELSREPSPFATGGASGGGGCWARGPFT